MPFHPAVSRRVFPVIAAALLGAGLASPQASTPVADAQPPVGTEAESDNKTTVDSVPEDDHVESDPSIAFEVAAFAEQFGVSMKEAEAALRVQDRSVEFGAELEQSFPTQYGGMWFGSETVTDVMAAIKDPSKRDIAKIDDLASKYGLGPNVNVVPVRYSFAELEQALNVEVIPQLTTQRGALGAIAPHWGIDVEANQIEVSLDAEIASRAAALTLVGRLESAQEGMVTVTFDAEVMENEAGCVLPFCDPPLRAGIGIGTNAGGTCSGAFLGRSRSDNKLYQFTAGHCSTTNVTWVTRNRPNQALRTIGPLHSRTNGNGDTAIIRVLDNNYWQARAWVFVTSGPDTTPNTQYPIWATATSTSNSFVCRSGRSTTTCGTISHLSSGYTSQSTGVTYTNLLRVGYCSTGGDSGGPVYKLNRAWGIHSGGSTTSCTKYFTWIVKAENDRNVNVSIDHR